MAYSHQWKAHERNVAKALQGFRIPRGANFSKSLPDVVADSSLSIARSDGVIIAECKYSINQPWVREFKDIYKNKLISIAHQDTSLILFELNDIHLLSDPYRCRNAIKIDKNIPKYIEDNLLQAQEYIEIVRKDALNLVAIQAVSKLDLKKTVLPIVVLAEKGKSFRLAYTSLLDLMVFYSSQNDQGFRLL